MKALIASLLFATLLLSGCSTPDDVASEITASKSSAHVDGIGIAIVVDCSGSMADSTGGDSKAKIDLAKNAVLQIVKQAQDFSKQKNVNVQVAVYRFSDSTQLVIPLSAPDVDAFTSRVNTLRADGGTAIGEAVVQATKDLNQQGFSDKHILVVTDGENNTGRSPESVANGINLLAPDLKPKVYLVAFDVDSHVFSGAKGAGWMVLSANNGQQLQSTLNEIVTGEILLEK